MTLNSTITYNGAIPAEGPQAIGALIDQQANQTTLIDLSHLISTGKLSGVQTIYVDLNNCDSDVTIVSLGTDQLIVAKAGTQGYYPILATNLLKFNITNFKQGKFKIYFINFPIALGVWGLAGASNELNIKNNLGDGFEIAGIELNEITLKKLVAGNNIAISENSDGNLLIESTGGGGGGGEIIENSIDGQPISYYDTDTNTRTLFGLESSNDIVIRWFGGTTLAFELREKPIKATQSKIQGNLSLNSLGNFIDFSTFEFIDLGGSYCELLSDGFQVIDIGAFNLDFNLKFPVEFITGTEIELLIYLTIGNTTTLNKVYATPETDGAFKFQTNFNIFDPNIDPNYIKLKIYSPIEISDCNFNLNIVKLNDVNEFEQT